MRKTALLVIDGQNDFILPGVPLSVPGAVEDMKRIISFIELNGSKIQNITSSLDSHRTLDIAHPSWWQHPDGTLVSPFTPISAQDLKDGKYTARINPQWSYSYVQKLEDQGEFGHFIWPYHCIIGTEGAALYSPYSKAINHWEETSGIPVTYVTKGDNPYTEHFGIFRANIEIPSDPKTQLNQDLLTLLSKFDQVLLGGQARSHCVANSAYQLVKEFPSLIPKLTIVEDWMSDVPNMPQSLYDRVDAIYAEAKAAGAKFAKSTDVTF